MHTGILGGVFNPPHLGHLLIAQQVLDFTDIEEIWFMPNYGQHPPKAGVAPVVDRVAMTKLLKLPQTRVSTLEIDHRLDGNTINLIPYLPKEHRFTFIMGSDWLPGFTKWGKWQELIKVLPFLVVPRAGYSSTPLYPNMTVLNHPLFITTNISSTLVRKRIKQGLIIDQLVPSGVKKYLMNHGLYLK